MNLKPERRAIQFLDRGLQTSRPTNRLDEAKYLRLRNVRTYLDGTIRTRPGLERLTSTPAGAAIHSMARLNVTVPEASQARTLLLGSDTNLYSTNNTFTTPTLIDSGYSGNYLSFIPHRPTQSAETWMYVADALRMRKVRVDGSNYPIGIAPPLSAPTAQIGAPVRTTVSDFETLGAWTAAGDAGAIAVGNRLSGATTISRILYDSGSTGLASVEPSLLDDNLQPGMFLIADAGGTPELFVVEQVYRAIVSTTIAAIVYDSGNTGMCTIQLASTSVGLERDALIRLNAGGGSDEAVRVLSMTDGPDGLASIRVLTVNSHAAGETVDGLGSFRAYFNSTHTASKTLTTNKFRSTLTFATGVGYLNLVGSVPLATSSDRPIQPDDEIHISLRLDNPANLLEARVMFDVDANVNDFTRNYYYYPINQNSLTQALQNTTTTATAQQRIAQQQQLADYYGGAQQPTTPPPRRLMAKLALLDDGYLPYDDYPYGYDPVPFIPNNPTGPAETTPGNNQWTELKFKVRDLIRVGGDSSRTLKNVAALRIQFQITATTVVDVDAWWIGGTYGPDASQGSGYYYAYTGRSSLTGATSNPSPPIRSVVVPIRQRVTGELTQHPDAQVDVLDIYRFGGTLNRWRYVTTVPNDLTPTFIDDFPDDVITANPEMEQDNYQPFPSTDVPRAGFCNAYGTKIRWVSGDIFNQSWGRNSLVRVNGVPYTLYTQPRATALSVSGATNATPIVVATTANHGLNTGDGISLAGVGGNTAANGNWRVTVLSPTTFSLDLSVGSGAYTSGGTATLYELETNENVGNLTAVSFELPDALLLGQPLPVMWGPYGGGLGGVFMFACGDPRLPGTLFITKGNNPDSSFYRLEITSGSEVLVNGCVYDGRCYVFSNERMYGVEPINGGQDWIAREVANSIGLFSPWCLTVGDRINFMGKDGIYETEGGAPRSLTDEVIYDQFLHEGVLVANTTVSQVPRITFDPSLMRFDHYKNMLYFTYGNGGFPIPQNQTYVYDTAFKRWVLDTYAPSGRCVCANEGPDFSNTVLVGCEDGHVYFFNSGSTTDANVAYSCSLMTGFDELGDPRTEKQVMEVFVDMDTPTFPTIALFANNDTSSAVDVLAGTGVAGRAVYTLDVASGAGRLARSVALQFQWDSQALTFFEYHYSFYPKAEKTLRRFTDWHDLGALGDKRISAFVLRADTFSGQKTITLQYDGGQVAGTFNVNTNNELGVAFALTVPVVAKLVRFTTTDPDPWILYDVDFQFEQYPELLPIVPDYDSAGDIRNKWLFAFELDADTGGLPVTLQLQADGGVVVETFTVTHSGRVVLPYDLNQPAITHAMRLVPLAGGSIRVFGVRWIWEAYPENLATTMPFENGGTTQAKWLMGFTLEADTLNEPATVQLQGDEGVVLQTYTITHNGKVAKPYDLTIPAVTHDMRLVPIAGTLRIFSIAWEFDKYPENWATTAPPDNAGDPRAKWLQGMEVECDTLGEDFTFELQGDGGTVLQTYTINCNGKQIVPLSLDDPAFTHEMKIVPTAGTWRVWGTRWIFEIEPELVDDWIAQPTTFEVDGFKCLGPTAYVTHRSTQDLTLTITIDGVINTYTIPHSSGTMRTDRVVLRVSKGRNFQFKITSSAGFRPYKLSTSFQLKRWGDANAFNTVRPFGEESPGRNALI